MEAIQKELKRLIARDTEASLQRLSELLNTDSPRYEDYTFLNNRFQKTSLEERRGTRSPEYLSVEYNQITAGLVDLVNDLKPTDLLLYRSKEEQRKVLHDFHRFTCDRKIQNLQFTKQFKSQKEEKIQFFYIYGEEKQSPHGLFQRFSHHVEGSLLDFRTNNAERETESIKEEITFELYHDLEYDQQEVLSNLFAEFNVPFDQYEPITEKKIDFLYENSPRIQELGIEDFVCVLLDISSYNWDEEAVPELIRWFCGNFCEADLPEDAPTFLFFFAIIFEEPDEEVQQQVETAVKNSQYLFPLPELTKVPIRDIKSWFATYRFITSTQESRTNLIKTFFPEESEYDMEDIEQNLEKIINDYNNNLLE